MSPGWEASEACPAYGFVDMSSFSRSFELHYGLSPREWRVFDPDSSTP